MLRSDWASVELVEQIALKCMPLHGMPVVRSYLSSQPGRARRCLKNELPIRQWLADARGADELANARNPGSPNRNLAGSEGFPQ
jgi:hypothetical protein